MVRHDKRTTVKRNVWCEDLSITIADQQTVGSTTIAIYGTITRFVLTLPDLDTDTTAILSIEDPNGKEIYSSGAQSDNGDSPLAVEGEVCGLLTFKITCTTAQTGAKACTVAVYVK